MSNRLTGCTAALVLAMLACSLWAEQDADPPKKPATAAEPATTGAANIKLIYNAGPDMASAMTPRRLVGKAGFQSTTGTTSLALFGKDVQVLTGMVNRIGTLGIDSNGNGTVDRSECAQIQRGKPLVMRIKLEDKKEAAVIFQDVEIRTSNNVTIAQGKYFAACGTKGAIDGQAIRIIDDNLDGKITQDGSDAIAIGRSMFAIPLMKTHQVGSAIYQLEVAEDGLSMTASKVTDAKLIPVKSPLLKVAATKALVLTDAAAGISIDLAGNRAGIPAGNYTLCYGVLSNGKDVVTISPGDKPEKYDVSEDADTLKLGPPLTLTFSARLDGEKINVFPNMEIKGGGGEIYSPDFGSTLGKPVVQLMDETRILSKESMSYG